MRVAEDVTKLVGNTPLVRLNRVTSGCAASVVAKLESYNPMHSVKDRIAVSMLEEAEERGELTPGSTIVEPTSGNTGIALAFVCAARGYGLIVTMPDVVSRERKALLEAFGARVVLTPGEEGMLGAVNRAEELAREIPNSFMPAQFSNPSNPCAHRDFTATEIWRDTDGLVDIVTGGIGTGGTICGIAEKLKSLKSSVEIVGVEPENSSVLSGGTAGQHAIQGIGAGFIPDIWRPELVDEIVLVSESEAENTARDLARKEGLFVGISSGAAAAAAIRVAKREKNRGKLLVVIFPDAGERYMSTGMFTRAEESAEYAT